MFTKSFFEQNRKSLSSAVPDCSLFIVSANGLLQRSGDTTFPFRQDSNFWYLTGINEPDILLVMDGQEEYLIIPGRDTVREVFDGNIDTELLQKVSGISAIYGQNEGWQKLESALSMYKKIGTCFALDAYSARHGFYANPARASLISKLKQAELQDIRKHLAELRMIKQPSELQALQMAIDISVGAFQQVKTNISSLAFEYEAEALIAAMFRKNNVRDAYTPIIASGKNACTLHYIQNSDKLVRENLLLIDAGAEYSNYAADITRTYSLSRPTARQTEVYQAVCELQDFAFGYIKPGITMHDYEIAVEAKAGTVLQKLGLIDSIEREKIRHYYTHATSHYLGLDVHDVGNYERPLEPGMVMTVEPGIYIPEEGIGIRIEDNILITKDGMQNLSAGLPRDL